MRTAWVLGGMVACTLFASVARADGAEAPPRDASVTSGAIVQLRSAVAAPLGGAIPLAIGRVDRVVRTEVVPVRLDVGYRYARYYVGVFAQKAHAQTSSAHLVTDSGAALRPSVADFSLGVTAEVHAARRVERFDPWIGVYGARRSMWLTSSDAQGLRLKGPEVGVTAGLDLRVAGALTIGLFGSAGYSFLSVSIDDDSQPVDARATVAWLGAGLRLSWQF